MEPLIIGLITALAFLGGALFLVGWQRHSEDD